MPIQRLDKDVVAKIAAGEIIVRPAAAVKEMLENSLDAKATNITITCRGGGLASFEVSDDGTGIDPDDLPLLCERYATSKLQSVDDLQKVATLGFRGEALASISHVAQVHVTTMRRGDDYAMTANYANGQLVPPRGSAIAVPRKCAGTVGTTISVENLFYNLQVRAQHMKGPTEEHQRIVDVIQRYAVHHSHCGFRCQKPGGAFPDVATVKNSTPRRNITQLYGPQVGNHLIEVQCDHRAHPELQYRLIGLMTGSGYQGDKRATTIVFINGRLVDPAVYRKALDVVYADYLPRGRHPFVYLDIWIKPERLDINAHPTKQVVRYINDKGVVSTVGDAVRAALVTSTPSHSIPPSTLSESSDPPAPHSPPASPHRVISSLPEPHQHPSNVLLATNASDLLTKAPSEERTILLTATATVENGTPPGTSRRTFPSTRDTTDIVHTKAPPSKSPYRASGSPSSSPPSTRYDDLSHLPTSIASTDQPTSTIPSGSPTQPVAFSSIHIREEALPSCTSEHINASFVQREGSRHTEKAQCEIRDEQSALGSETALTEARHPIPSNSACSSEQPISDFDGCKMETIVSLNPNSNVEVGLNDGRKRDLVESCEEDGPTVNAISAAPSACRMQSPPHSDSSFKFRRTMPSSFDIDIERSEGVRSTNYVTSLIPNPAPGELTSVFNIRCQLLAQKHPTLNGLLCGALLGLTSDRWLIVRWGDGLYRLDASRLLIEAARQRALAEMHSRSRAAIEFEGPSHSIKELVRIALDYDGEWKSADGSKDTLASNAHTILMGHRPVLENHFGIVINDSGHLDKLPWLLEPILPALWRLPTFILRLAVNVQWTTEQRCFETILSELAELHALPHDDCFNVLKTTIIPMWIRDGFILPRQWASDGSIVYFASLRDIKGVPFART